MFTLSSRNIPLLSSCELTVSFYLENLCVLLNFNSAQIFIRQRTIRLKLNKSAIKLFFSEPYIYCRVI